MSLRFATRLLLFLFLFFGGLYYAQEFLIPVAFGSVLAMLFLPVCNWLERKGVGKSVATLLCVLSLILTAAALFTLMGWQVSTLISDVGNMEKKINESIAKGQQWLTETMGVSAEQQKKAMQQSSGGGGGVSGMTKSLPPALMSGLADLIITLIYFFLFLRFRLHLKRFVLKIVPEPDRRTALEVMHGSSGVIQKYLSGVAMMIMCLWVMYGIGFSIVGVEGAIFFAILCGTLELVPFVGNLVGTALTMLFSLTQAKSGGAGMVLGIFATYVIVQGIQSYILEPLVVGREVKIHPLFTILVIVLGELVWGLAGMFLSIPLLGIAKIVCDHVPALQPIGYLIGEEENVNDSGWKERIRGKLSRVFRR
jgi:predicted PurR-regulated permease PerM